MSTTSNKTKDWLKNQLVTHGVPLPAASAKKEEYQRLYEEQVLPQQSNAEFSSDDDTEPVTTPSPQPRANSVAKNTKKSDGEPAVDKRTDWVQGMSDQNLFDALSANGRNPGPIVDSTRDLYRKMLLDILGEDEHKALENIEKYLSENKEAREQWLENGLDLHGFNGVTNGTNGNAENGFSDTDEDEAIETASRASRSSRASSIRATPTPVKQQVDSLPSTPKSPFESKPLRARPSSSLRGGLNFSGTSGMEIHESEVTASSSRTETLLYSRVTSPGRTPYKPLLSSTRNELLNDEDTEDADEPDVVASRKAPRKNSKLVLQSLLLLVSILVIPCAIYLFFFQNKSNDCQEGVDCPDELDVLLKSLDEADGVQDGGN